MTTQSENPAISKELTIKNRNGLHARPAALFVKTSSRFHAEVWVEKDGEKVNGKSIMGLMMLAAGKDSRVRFLVTGDDALEMLAELEALFLRKFDEA